MWKILIILVLFSCTSEKKYNNYSLSYCELPDGIGGRTEIVEYKLQQIIKINEEIKDLDVLERVVYHEFGHYLHNNTNPDENDGFEELFADAFSHMVLLNLVPLNAITYGENYCKKNNIPYTTQDRNMAYYLLLYYYTEKDKIEEAKQLFEQCKNKVK